MSCPRTTMNASTNQDGGLFPEAQKSRRSASELLKARQDQFLDACTAAVRRTDKWISHAHYRVGAIVLGDPKLRALVAEGLETHLKALGPQRRVVDDYSKNVEERERLRSLLRGQRP